MIDFIKFLWQVRKLINSKEYRLAKSAVEVIATDKGLRNLGELESTISYCPRCGQKPDRDVRHDAAFFLAYGELLPKARTRDLHFILELANYLRH